VVNSETDVSLQGSLLGLRLGVSTVMLVWTLDKFFNPAHAAKVFDAFYGMNAVTDTTLAVIASIQLLIVLLFVTGSLKRFSYLAVLVMHGISTFSSWRQYLDPFDNLLFFAAWPMLAACVALYSLRDQDSLLSVDHWLERRR